MQTTKAQGFEYRVAHLQAVENYLWHRCSIHGTDYHFGNDDRTNCNECYTGQCNHLKCHIQNAREMWKGCKVHTDRVEALKEADAQYQEVMKDDMGILEYGISFIEIDREF